MIILLTLLAIIIVGVIVVLSALGSVGVGFLIMFSDAIVGGMIVYFIVRAIVRKKRK